jgi:hypothetical protein
MKENKDFIFEKSIKENEIKEEETIFLINTEENEKKENIGIHHCGIFILINIFF